MGELYKAGAPQLGRELAIKVLPPHLSSSAKLRECFEREAKTISQLSHPDCHTFATLVIGESP